MTLTHDDLVGAFAMCARERDPAGGAALEGRDLVARFGMHEHRIIYMMQSSWMLKHSARMPYPVSRWSIENKSVWFPDKFGQRVQHPVLDAKYKVFAEDAARLVQLLAEPGLVETLSSIPTDEHFKASQAGGVLTLTWSLILMNPNRVTDRKPVLIPRVRTLIWLGLCLSR